jgi:hypothetical protein
MRTGTIKPDTPTVSASKRLTLHHLRRAAPIHDGGFSHAVSADDRNKTICGESGPDVTDQTWVSAPAPRCQRCIERLSSMP